MLSPEDPLSKPHAICVWVSSWIEVAARDAGGRPTALFVAIQNIDDHALTRRLARDEARTIAEGLGSIVHELVRVTDGLTVDDLWRAGRSGERPGSAAAF